MTVRECKDLAIVVPLFNEASGLRRFHKSLMEVVSKLPMVVKIWYVDDGSTDGTSLLLEDLASGDDRLHIIELSRNFGHQSALTAGLDYAQGDVTIVMDGDGQHPVELIPKMLEVYSSGFDTVLTQRLETEDDSKFKKLSSMVFYGLINRISNIALLPNSADFRLMSRESVEAVKGMREYHRFIRGMVCWVGFRQAVLPYRAPRRIAGETQYSLSKMLALASHAIFSFSTAPLKICVLLGVLLIALSIGEVAYNLYIVAAGRRSELVPGWPSLMFFIIAIGGAQLVMLGIIGHYIAYIFEEVKRRPIYVIRSLVTPKTEERRE